jgi:O-antigen ligase
MNSLAGTIAEAQPRYTTSKLATTLSQGLQTITASFLFLFVLVQPLSIAASHIAYAGAALAWLLHLLTTRGRTLKRSPLDFVILLYLALCTLSTFFSPLPLSSWEGMRKVALIFLVLVVAHNVPNLRRARQLLAGLFVSSLIAFGWAGWNYVDGVGLRIHNPRPGTAFYAAGIRDNDVILRVDGKDVESPREFLQVVNSEAPGKPIQLRVVHGGGIEIMKDAVLIAVPSDNGSTRKNLENLGMEVETDRPARARAFYSHYVTYAAVLQILGCLVFGLCLSHYRRAPVSGAVLGLLFIAFGIALAMTLTRASWLALAFGCAVELWFCLGKLGRAIVLPAILIVAVGATSVLMHRWRGMGIIDRSDPGTDYRILMWEDGLKLIETHPWFGVGMNVIRDEPSKFDLRAYKKYGMELHFHSTPIELGVELGLLVLGAWVALMAVYWLLLVRLVARSRNATDPFPYGLSLGILGATTGFLATSLVHYDFGDSVVVFLVWFLMGLALALNDLLGRSAHSAGTAA